MAGTVAANSIAMFDPASGSWSPLGTGVNGGVNPSVSPAVHALTVLPNGDLVAGGQFTSAGGVSAFNLARWNGTAWSAFGGIAGATVTALTTLPNGDVVAGYTTGAPGPFPVFQVASWNGVAWSPLGANPNGSVTALTTLANGAVVAAGEFTNIGGVAANRVARWSGTSWSPLGTGMNLGVRALTTLPNGDVVAGGSFTTAGGVAASRIASWNGAVWSPLGAGTGGSTSAYVAALTTLPNGDVVAGGSFTTAGGVAASRIASWNGVAWSPLGAGTSGAVLAATTLPNGDVVAGGEFAMAGGVPASRIASWNGATWTPLGAGTSGAVLAVTTLPNGDVVAGGLFATAGGVAASCIARWDGTAWSPLGPGTNGAVAAVTTLPNGDVVAGGEFTTAGGVAANCIARWDGTSWSPLAAGVAGGPILSPLRVNALTTLPNGDVVAGGNFTTAGGVAANCIARWDGTSWSPLGTGVVVGPVSSLVGVNALTTLPNGDVVAGGYFTTAGGVAANYIARWDGAAWSPLGTGTGYYVASLATLPNGDVAAGGPFITAGGAAARYIARWNGASWSPLGTGMNGGVNPSVYALTVLPNGDLVAGGQFTSAGTLAGSVAANNIARWNGTAWSPLGTGMNSFVRALTTLPNGFVAAGGDFTTADGSVSAYFARLTTTCPATVAPQGVGCTGSGGANVLAATALPWIGSTFRARGTGMPPLGLVVAAMGFSTLSLPLSSVLPQGQPGCNLLVSPDLLDVLLPVAGTADSQIVLPNTPSLVGQSFHHQMVPLELDASSAITAITATNALTATIGVF